MTLGRRIRDLRIAANLDVPEVAKKINVSVSTVYMYERDERIPPMDKLESLANLFNVTVDYLINRSISPIERLEQIGVMLRSTPDLTHQDVDDVMQYIEALRKRNRAIGKGGVEKKK